MSHFEGQRLTTIQASESSKISDVATIEEHLKIAQYTSVSLIAGTFHLIAGEF